ncbi:MAG TPA: GNAT family N-acetyltransferase [Gammaproteobacteria bacterium]|jgi:hypothetical protein|nr:GNAT family N-acetyltransferase [Gammaproteobacteria bacterium]
MQHEFNILRLKGKEIFPYISDLAKLRIAVFKEYPYLYHGNLEYEKNYLKTYTACSESIMILVIDKQRIVGASTAIPLEFETEACIKPFLDYQMKIQDIFYLGESVLLPDYRGKNIYRRFFHERESAAMEYGSKIATFCAVERSLDDPRRPQGWVSLDKVWQHFNYKKHPTLCAYYEWKELGEETKSAKSLVFWIKNLCTYC